MSAQPSFGEIFALSAGVELIVSTSARAGVPICLPQIVRSLSATYPEAPPAKLAEMVSEAAKDAWVPVTVDELS